MSSDWDLEHMYRKMVTIRLLEERLQRLCDEGKAGDLHFNRGQEAISVGVCEVLCNTDRIVTHHRTIAHYIAKGGDVYPLVAELLGKKTGVNKGRAGEMHLSNPEIGYEFSFQLVGTCIPVAVGLAYALKNIKKSREIVTVFFGDAAISNGQFHEGVNLAAIHELPILFVCENNERAGNITPEHYRPHLSDPKDYFDMHGIQCDVIDGNNVARVAEHTFNVLDNTIRLEDGPYALICNTNRLCWHKQGQKDIRSAVELAELEKDEPISKVEKNDLLFEEASEYQEIKVEVSKELDEVFARVESDPIAEVYVDD